MCLYNKSKDLAKILFVSYKLNNVKKNLTTEILILMCRFFLFSGQLQHTLTPLTEIFVVIQVKAPEVNCNNRSTEALTV